MLTTKTATLIIKLIGKKGYSGHFKHAGRPGFRGGSAPSYFLGVREHAALYAIHNTSSSMAGLGWLVKKEDIPAEYQKVYDELGTTPFLIREKSKEIVAQADKRVREKLSEYCDVTTSSGFPPEVTLPALAGAYDAISDVMTHVPRLSRFNLNIAVGYDNADLDPESPFGMTINVGTASFLMYRTPDKLREILETIRERKRGIPIDIIAREERTGGYAKGTETMIQKVIDSMESGRYDFPGYHSFNCFPPERMFEATVRHELGHLVTRYHSGEVGELIYGPTFPLVSMGPQVVPLKYPTERSKDNLEEFLAESFTLYSIGKTELVDDRVNAMYERITTWYWPKK